jgi:hypothetical protein
VIDEASPNACRLGVAGDSIELYDSACPNKVNSTVY